MEQSKFFKKKLTKVETKNHEGNCSLRRNNYSLRETKIIGEQRFKEDE
jgi:hypothetical protein